ncbi:hypothetical protein L210DRAFT_3651687 [Boletus edulis BED1]|uniref:Uncharacterized protein n=1 Tax=Boletus edulis BED1 TaxID=1328754 RepID=A0AAD4BI16_BOLED|nr:hypothetical protein L210DRAFT_3651687 [Boletus edulis BED1]
MLDDPLLTFDDPLSLDEHDDSSGDFCGSSQAPSSLGYDSGTPAAYWSSRSSSPFSDFSGYSNNLGDMNFTTMLNTPLPYFPTAVPSSAAAMQNSVYSVPYASPAFNYLGPSLFEAPQGVPHINHSNSSTCGLVDSLIPNQTDPLCPTPSTLSNALSGAEYLQAVAPNVGQLNDSNPCLMISAQMAPNSKLVAVHI